MSAARKSASSFDRWHTTQEIMQQPGVWRGFARALSDQSSEVQAWLKHRNHDEVWFCGAGTSAFIGDTLAAWLGRSAGRLRFRSIPTTDFVSCPKAYIRGAKVLVVSFGRSGNSSETVAMLDQLSAHAPEYDRLNITCNSESALAKDGHSGPGETRTILLTPQTNDRGFAMTSSYTTMLLSALACFDPAPPAPVDAMMQRLADAAQKLIETNFARLEAFEVPERAVFLGSGPLTGAARESALKVLELAAGNVTTSWDSTLGFRHGPKAVVNDKTLVFVLESSDPYTSQYDVDLANEIARQFGSNVAVRVGSRADVGIHVPSMGNDGWSAVLYVIIAQMLAVIWSDKLGLPVDDPFAGRNLTRVVTGVKVYDLSAKPTGVFGAMDIGGTKIEATLFDANLDVIETSRVDTGKATYSALVDSIVERAGWLRDKAGAHMPIGLGLPGLVDRETGASVTSNLPATWQSDFVNPYRLKTTASASPCRKPMAARAKVSALCSG